MIFPPISILYAAVFLQRMDSVACKFNVRCQFLCMHAVGMDRPKSILLRIFCSPEWERRNLRMNFTDLCAPFYLERHTKQQQLEILLLVEFTPEMSLGSIWM